VENKYQKWITQNVKESYGTCQKVTKTMANDFPELKRVRGHYDCPLWGERAHWWLIALDGTIVDPTLSQFPTGGAGAEYVEWVEGTKEPTGMCPNCGGYCYDGSYCCTDKCHREFVASLGV